MWRFQQLRDVLHLWRLRAIAYSDPSFAEALQATREDRASDTGLVRQTVTYRVEFHASALAQLQGLPSSAFDALVERVSKLVGAPLETQILDRDEPNFRQCLGLPPFHVDDDREQIRIFDVTWGG